MSGIGSLTGYDSTHLQWASSIAIKFFIQRYDDIEKVAERFCCNDMGTAMEDIMVKGLQEFLDMCDMDDKFAEEEARMPNIPAGKGGSI